MKIIPTLNDIDLQEVSGGRSGNFVLSVSSTTTDKGFRFSVTHSSGLPIELAFNIEKSTIALFIPDGVTLYVNGTLIPSSSFGPQFTKAQIDTFVQDKGLNIV